jgi:uncharacterized protein YgbK (DUF1537 family)
MARRKGLFGLGGDAVDEPRLALTLRSGNFGGENLLAEALNRLP